MKTKNTSGGVGYQSDTGGRLGDFVAFTGGSFEQRKLARDYSKAAHKAHAKALSAKESADDASVEGSAPRIVAVIGGSDTDDC